MTEIEARKRLKELSKDLNGLSHESAEGNAVFNLSKNDDNEEWIVSVSGSLCTGTDNDGSPYWMDAEEALNGDSSWSGKNLKKLIQEVEIVVSDACI